MTGPPWWRSAVGYEVYVRSFADADGDGVGDLAGLLAHLDHLVDLGVDLVWITPFYPSPMHDHGYDVADYTGVAPEFGTLADVDAVVAAAHRLGLRVIVDLVPNHSSSEHPWFRASRSSRDDPHREYYIWRDPAPDGGPPNNWKSVFGGEAWTLDRQTGQYWLHLFLPEQPDLNWENPAVAEEFDAILRFWLDRGIDGFRVDVAHALMKHPRLEDNPPAPPAGDAPDEAVGSVATSWETIAHVHDVDQPDVLSIYRRWRRIADEYDALLLGEVYLLEADRLMRYVAEDDGLAAAFWFPPLHLRWNLARLRGVLREGVDLALRVQGDIAWVLGSHDRPRMASRYGSGAVGRARALAVATLQLFLPGMPFVYQGEELGLEDGVVPPEDAQDPIAVRGGEPDRGRDVARTPMPWAPGPGLGFTSAERAWLPFGGRTAEDTVEVQRGEPTSPLSTYRRLIKVRRALLTPDDPFAWLTEDGSLLGLRRGAVLVFANLGEVPVALPSEADGLEVRYSTHLGRPDTLDALAPWEAVVLAPKV